jgi:hypothetical protein
LLRYARNDDERACLDHCHCGHEAGSNKDIASTWCEAIHINRSHQIMGTIIVSIILLVIVALVILSLIKAKRSGRHPSCGGNCGSCGQICKAAYPNSTAFLKNHSKSLKNQNYKLADNNK